MYLRKRSPKFFPSGPFFRVLQIKCLSKCPYFKKLPCPEKFLVMRLLHQHTGLVLYHLGRNGKLLKFLRILIAAVYFKGRNWISKTVYCVSCSVVCKIAFSSEFPDIPDNAGWQKNKKKKNTGNLKALCVSRKRKK